MVLRITRSIIPNLFTLANLFSGFLAVVHFAHALKEPPYVIVGAYYVLAAAIFDMLDGIVARLARAASELGVELDSLCDIVSFGVAPSVLLYVLHYHGHGPAGMLIAALPAMAGAYRLARFNVQLTSLEDKQYFRGLPIPAGALTIVSYCLFYLYTGQIPPAWQEIATNFVTIATALAMVSTVRYDNIPRPSRAAIRQRPVFTSVFVLAIAAVILSRGQLAFPLMVAYIAFGAIRHAVLQLQEWKKERLTFEDFED
ncbi:MAG: CDP-diacylglycerol--serine O-phosphatidyltransferase [Bacteroidota bacterium]|nr:CDP-diacylglycerol--serine O-phosphatidyltransferase [Candidatus Kapabacteria bacterium]MDW8074384.1 CDP-diacylglycerol--serine O-phosphatidyltransferase [Bacteroidota bacterium]MDW8271140.1 CDP-diacylglycerol--serine O-phosphatidyltransferase [Bacteroidota bacterium]